MNIDKKERGIFITPKYEKKNYNLFILLKNNPLLKDISCYLLLCLSNEIIIHILKFLDIQDLLHCCSTCRKLYEFSKLNILWKRLFNQLFIGYKKHFYQVSPRHCSFVLSINENNEPIYVCDKVTHYIDPSLSNKIKKSYKQIKEYFKKNNINEYYYYLTKQRIFELFYNSLFHYEKEIRNSSLLCAVKINEIIHKVELEKLKLKNIAKENSIFISEIVI